VKATYIERFLSGGETAAVRIKTDEGKTYVFILEWQKLLANDIDAVLVNDFQGDSYPETVVKMPKGYSQVIEGQWIQDPIICRIVRDAGEALSRGDFIPQEIPVSRYYGEPMAKNVENFLGESD
jgi:hypothetical protein